MSGPGQQDERDDDLSRMRQCRAAHRAHVLAELRERRPDLWGVHSPADLAAEAVLWSA